MKKSIVISFLLLPVLVLAQPDKKYTSLIEALKTPSLVYELDLSKKNYSVLPSDIGKLKNLKYLYLEKNKLTSLPKSIGKLKNLVFIRIDDNQLTTVPKSMGNCTNLKSIQIIGNKLTSLPISLAKLKNLESLIIWGNKINKVEEAKIRSLFPHMPKHKFTF